VWIWYSHVFGGDIYQDNFSGVVGVGPDCCGLSSELKMRKETKYEPLSLEAPEGRRQQGRTRIKESFERWKTAYEKAVVEWNRGTHTPNQPSSSCLPVLKAIWHSCSQVPSRTGAGLGEL
jgi:hypothetical protein